MLCCTFRNAILFIFIVSTAFGLASAVNCPSVDDNGTPLTGSSNSGGTVTCTYQGAGACVYFPINGSFSSGSSTCPKGEPQNETETASTGPPPATTAPESTTTLQAPPTISIIPPPSPPPTISTIPPPPLPTTSSAPITTLAPPIPSPITTASPTTALPSTFSVIVVMSTTSLATTNATSPSATPTNNAAVSLRGNYGQSAVGVVAFIGAVLAMNLMCLL
ncbi:hypothetical protein H2248_011766 [Termitomyces sp. 'cryptogamus']|nr:hypothetical protein H2248_011766 [Termitomyces sp. 'cryptogamus']